MAKTTIESTDTFGEGFEKQNAMNTEIYGLQDCEFHIATPQNDIELNDDGTTWTKIPNMAIKGIAIGFTATGGTLTHSGIEQKFVVNGVSQVAVNKACSIFYGLSIDGAAPDSDHTTEHTFSVQSKIENMAIVSIDTLAQGTTQEVWAKGDGTSGIEISVAKLDIVFAGRL